jgi:glucokinase
MRIIGVDIGGTSIKAAIVDERGCFLSRFSMKVEPRAQSEDILRNFSDLLKKTLEENRLGPKDILGIGVGCPGSINSVAGVCDYSNNLGWRDVPLASFLEKETGIPASVANDANAAILGEVRFGVAKQYHNVVLLTLGTGVGGGLYLNDRLYEGNEGKGAELGHSLLVMGGRKCTCGRRGCLEAYASANALIKDTRKAMKKNPSSRLWAWADRDLAKIDGRAAFECAKLGDITAQEVLDRYFSYLGEGCLSLINIFRPDALILGGGLSGQKEALTEPLKDYLKKRGYGFGGTISPQVEVLVSRLGNDAGILGAAALCLPH